MNNQYQKPMVDISEMATVSLLCSSPSAPGGSTSPYIPDDESSLFNDNF